MRSSFLTDYEKKLLEEYTKGIKSKVSIRMLLYRINKFLPAIKEDIKLCEEAKNSNRIVKRGPKTYSLRFSPNVSKEDRKKIEDSLI